MLDADVWRLPGVFQHLTPRGALPTLGRVRSKGEALIILIVESSPRACCVIDAVVCCTFRAFDVRSVRGMGVACPHAHKLE